MSGTVKRLVIALMVVVGLVTAACSSSKKSSSSSATTAAPGSTAAPGGSNTTAAPSGNNNGLNNAGGGSLADQANKAPLTGPAGTGLTRGITSTSILVGCVDEGQNFFGFQDGLAARFNRANSAGGVNGRKITVLPCKDDSAGVQANVSAVQELVNQSNVFAVFSASQYMLPGSTDFMVQNQVPFYGWGFLPGFCGNRWGYGWNGCLAGNSMPATADPVRAIQGALSDAIIKAAGIPQTDCPQTSTCSQIKLAVQADNSAAGRAGNPQYLTLYKQRGASVVYSQTNYPANAAGADPTPYASAMVAANPNIIMISTPFQDVAPIRNSLTAAGYTGVSYDYTNYIGAASLGAAPALAKSLENEYVNTQIVPQEQETPFIKDAEADLKAIGKSPSISLGTEIGYIEAEQFVEELQAIGQQLDTKTWDQKINGSGSYSGFTAYADLKGGPGPMQFPAAHDLPADCAGIVQVKSAKYVVVEPFACYNSLPFNG